MATFYTRKYKNGDTAHYIQVSVNGKLKTTTYRQKQGTSFNEAKRKREQIATEFYNQCILQTEIKKQDYGKITFKEYASLWLRDVKSKSHKTYAGRIISDSNNFIGNMPLKAIKPHDIRTILRHINEKKIMERSAILIQPLNEIMKGKTQNLICNIAGISDTTFYYLRKGQQVQWSTAENLAKAMNINPHQYFKEITREPRNYAPNTKLGYKRVLNAIFNRAVLDKDISENPAKEVFKGAIKGEKRVKEILGEQEAKQLEQALAKEHIRIQAAISLMLFGAMRKCEACGLEWKDIDFNTRTIHLQRNSIYNSKDGVYTTETLKNGGDRKIQVPEKLINILKELKRYQDTERKQLNTAWENTDRVIVNWKGQPINPTTMRDWLTKVLVKNGIKKVDCHSLRHTCIVLLLRNLGKGKMSIGVVSAYAGHANPHITLTEYEKYLKEDEGKAATCLDDIFKTEQSNTTPPPNANNIIVMRANT